MLGGCGGEDEPSRPVASADTLLISYDGGDRVVATEHDQGDAALELTSGELVVRDGHGGAESPVFRARTFRTDFDDATVQFRLRNDGLLDGEEVDGHDYDGVSVGLRYTSPDELYYVNVHRRDGTVDIKRKADGEYTTLASAARDVPYGEWETVEIDIRTVSDGVELRLSFDGDVVLEVIDDQAPLLEPGRVLLRGDNCRFAFDDLSVTPV